MVVMKYKNPKQGKTTIHCKEKEQVTVKISNKGIKVIQSANVEVIIIDERK